MIKRSLKSVQGLANDFENYTVRSAKGTDRNVETKKISLVAKGKLRLTLNGACPHPTYSVREGG